MVEGVQLNNMRCWLCHELAPAGVCLRTHLYSPAYARQRGYVTEAITDRERAAERLHRRIQAEFAVLHRLDAGALDGVAVAS